MAKMFLDSAEMRELTQRSHRTSQAKVLRSMGIEHRSRPDGSMAVLRSHVEHILGGSAKISKKLADIEPNWSALNATRTQAGK